jgi:hypothetical protein
MLGQLLYSLLSSHSYSFSTQAKTLLASEAEVRELFRRVYSNKEKKIYWFYCLDYDRIFVDKHLMLIPVDDRMATRSHTVLDTIYIKKMYIINIVTMKLRGSRTLNDC